MQPVEISWEERLMKTANKIDEPPIESRLDSFAATYQQFLKHTDTNIELMQFKAFEQYLGLYVHYYEP